MRRVLVILWMLVGAIASAQAQVNVGIGIGLPGVSIGINLPMYPTLVAVPGYPVYYAPRANSNYFFYDGMYWVYQRDNWYASSWYNGPWWLIGVEEVPLFILRVPVRYYRQPPAYFRGWRADAPPRWGERWGDTWDQRHPGWDRWDHNVVPGRAPLPVYQKQYSGTRYPRAEQQPVLQGRNYRYQPREAVVQQHYQAQRAPGGSVPSVTGRRAEPQGGISSPPDQRGSRRPPPIPQAAPATPRSEPSSREGGRVERPSPAQRSAPQEGSVSPHPNRQPQQSATPRERPVGPPQPAVTPREPQARQPQQSDAPRGQQAKQRGGEKDRDKGEPRDGGREK